MRTCLGAIAVVLAHGVALGAQQDCVSLAAVLRGSSVVVKTKAEFESEARAYCGSAGAASGSGSQTGGSVGVGAFSLGASNSQSQYSTSYSNLCSNSTTLRDFDATYRQYVQSFDVQAYPVIERCLAMGKNNLIFDLQPGGITEASLTFSVVQTATTNMNTEVTFQASPGVSCRYSRRGKAFGSGNTVTLTNDDTVTAVCNRASSDRRDFINVSTRSSELPLVIPWTAYKGSVPVDLQQAAQRAQTEFEALKASLIGSVVGFHRTACPTGWKEYEAARGRFVRGIDAAGTTDPDGKRAPGALQEDAFAKHRHAMDSKGMQANGGIGFTGTGFDSNSTLPVTGRNTTDVGDKETRPKNVALLFCTLQ